MHSLPQNSTSFKNQIYKIALYNLLCIVSHKFPKEGSTSSNNNFDIFLLWGFEYYQWFTLSYLERNNTKLITNTKLILN